MRSLTRIAAGAGASVLLIVAATVTPDPAWGAVSGRSTGIAQGRFMRPTLASGSVYSIHADFFNAWGQPAPQSLVYTCLDGHISCGHFKGTSPGRDPDPTPTPTATAVAAGHHAASTGATTTAPTTSPVPAGDVVLASGRSPLTGGRALAAVAVLAGAFLATGALLLRRRRTRAATGRHRTPES